jgi:hypothetical protein
MGLQWAKPKLVKQNTLIIVKATMPGSLDRQLNDKLWELWREHKDAVKDKGFSVSKDQYRNNIWNVVCFIENTPANNAIEENGKKKWENKFSSDLADLEAMLGGSKKTTASGDSDGGGGGVAVSLDDVRNMGSVFD